MAPLLTIMEPDPFAALLRDILDGGLQSSENMIGDVVITANPDASELVDHIDFLASNGIEEGTISLAVTPESGIQSLNPLYDVNRFVAGPFTSTDLAHNTIFLVFAGAIAFLIGLTLVASALLKEEKLIQKSDCRRRPQNIIPIYPDYFKYQPHETSESPESTSEQGLQLELNFCPCIGEHVIKLYAGFTERQHKQVAHDLEHILKCQKGDNLVVHNIVPSSEGNRRSVGYVVFVEKNTDPEMGVVRLNGTEAVEKYRD